MAFLRIVRLSGSGGGTTSGSASTYVGDIGDIWADDVDFNTLRRGDGSTAGGVIISGPYNITEGIINKNVGVGTDALLQSTMNDPDLYNTAVGYNALWTNTGNAKHNTAVGGDSLKGNNNGSENTAIGFRTMQAGPDGSYNTAVGSEAMQMNYSATDNTAVGYQALKNNGFGVGNVAIGSGALIMNRGSTNTAVGNAALEQNTTGWDNVAIGDGAGGLGGVGNVFIGHMAGMQSPIANNQLVISNGQSYNDPDHTDLIRGNFSTGTVTFNEAFTFPSTDGTASQVLTTDGVGNLSWANETITLSTLKSITSLSTSFADFQSRIAAL